MAADTQLQVFADPAALAKGAGALMVEIAKASVAARGRFVVALSGGSTPKALYEMLAQSPLREAMPWKRTFMFLGDERVVPLDDQRSNYYLAYQALLRHGLLPQGHVFPTPVTGLTPAQSAQEYAKIIARFYSADVNGPPPSMDLVLLGLGDDGHTASLFPNALGLKDQGWVTWSPPGTLPPPVDRVTFTFNMINAARNAVFLVAGEKKAEIVSDILQNSHTIEERPSTGVKPRGTLLWMLDKPAAAKLSPATIAKLQPKKIDPAAAANVAPTHAPAKKPPIRLLVSDVDGTLVTHDKVLTDRARAAVAKLAEREIAFAIASGRPPRGMAMLVNPLSISTPIASFNGGMFVEPDMDEIEALTIPKEKNKTIVQQMRDAGLDIWIYRGAEWFVRKTDAPHVAREQFTVQFPPAVIADFDALLADDLVKIVGVSDDPEKIAKAEAALQAVTNISASLSQPYYLDVTNEKANKLGVVNRLSELLEIPHDQIATIGDGANDMLMFSVSGFSIAMGNASDRVKHAATVVTDSSESDGFAKAVEKYLLD